LNQYTAAGPATFTYDANGNLTSDGSTSFVYDIENRLVSASGAKTAALVYDPMGRLFETSGALGVNLTRYLYDGDELVACHRNTTDSENLHRDRWAGSLHRLATLVEQRTNATGVHAADEVVTDLQRSGGHEDRCDRSLARIE
jgi:hypothetical protein